MRLGAFLMGGLVIGAATWPLTYWMTYPISNEGERWWVVGFPFLVAVFDSEGRDYVGPLTMPGVVANGLFWFLVPQIVLVRLRHRPQPDGTGIHQGDAVA